MSEQTTVERLRDVAAAKMIHAAWDDPAHRSIGATSMPAAITADDAAKLLRLAEAVPDLLDWMERRRSGDETLHPEEYYIRRDEARIALNALTPRQHPSQRRYSNE